MVGQGVDHVGILFVERLEVHAPFEVREIDEREVARRAHDQIRYFVRGSFGEYRLMRRPGR
jgi:hypothetical protein